MIFGKNRDKGIRLNGKMEPEVVQLGNGIKEDDLLFHDEKAAEPSLAFMLSRMRYPDFPEPFGVLRDVDAPLFEAGVDRQLAESEARHGRGTLEKLLNSGDTWTVN